VAIHNDKYRAFTDDNHAEKRPDSLHICSSNAARSRWTNEELP
jgi:hypothetical protein